VIAEGYATAASIHEATGNPVAVAFSANNLQPVAHALMQRLVTGKLNGCGGAITIAADHDENGTGQKYAIEAAQAVGGNGGDPGRGRRLERHSRAARPGSGARRDRGRHPSRESTDSLKNTGDDREHRGQWHSC
jgi:phage/plasmid primase-like uncharacterized protein